MGLELWSESGNYHRVKDVPIIMFTGYNAFQYDQKAIFGANLLVNKPIGPDELLRLMGWFVGRA
jgi:CheY-like chemotaxis protein